MYDTELDEDYSLHFYENPETGEMHELDVWERRFDAAIQADELEEWYGFPVDNENHWRTYASGLAHLVKVELEKDEGEYR